MNRLDLQEIVKHPSYETFGYVFTFEDGLYRAIYPAYEEQVLELFRCGLIDELAANDLFPKSDVTDYQTPDCNLVIHHKKIHVVTLPFEWSFSMLKDAARVTLETNVVARKYGYETKDSHGFNVLFQFGTPLFVDLGSFVRIKDEFGSSIPGWRAYGEFMRSFLAPLVLWSRGESFFARHALHGDQMPMSAYWRYRNPLLRLIPLSILERFEYLYYRYKGLNTRSIEEFMQFASRTDTRERLAQWILWLAQRGLLLFSSVDLKRLLRRVNKIRPPLVRSKWGDYQSEMDVSDRHRFIVDCIERLEVKTVLDLGGNAGLLARLIVSNADIDYVISADYDENAVDKLYETLQTEPARIYPVLLDFGISVSDTKYRKARERLRSEAVVALALTHHLVLTQGMSLDFVFERIASFSSRYVLVEFMPLGCYSSAMDKRPTLPNWYKLEWFRSKFEQYFVTLEEKQLELNRILFVGELHASR